MDHIYHYRPIINKLSLKKPFLKITERILSSVSKSNSNLFHLTKLMFTPFSEASKDDQPCKEHCNLTLQGKKKRKDKQTLKTKYSKLKLNLNLNKSLLEQSPITSSFLLFKPKTRNKTKWLCSTNTLINKTNSINNKHIFDTSSFLKTSLNQTLINNNNTSTTVSKKTLPNLCLPHQTNHNKKGNALNPPFLLKSKANVVSPQPFDLYDPDKSAPATTMKKSPAHRDTTYSPCSFRKRCNQIENDCNEVSKAVKNMPMKLIFDKSKFNMLLNQSGEDDKDIFEDMPCSQIKKIFKTKDLMDVTIRSKRILQEADCIKKVDPFLAVRATKTLKNMFSLNHKPKDKHEHEQTMKRFSSKTDKIRDLLKHHLKSKKTSKKFN